MKKNLFRLFLFFLAYFVLCCSATLSILFSPLDFPFYLFLLARINVWKDSRQKYYYFTIAHQPHEQNLQWFYSLYKIIPSNQKRSQQTQHTPLTSTSTTLLLVKFIEKEFLVMIIASWGSLQPFFPYKSKLSIFRIQTWFLAHMHPLFLL